MERLRIKKSNFIIAYWLKLQMILNIPGEELWIWEVMDLSEPPDQTQLQTRAPRAHELIGHDYSCLATMASTKGQVLVALLTDKLCNVKISSTRNGGTHRPTVNDLSFVYRDKNDPESKKDNICWQTTLICINQWFLKQDVPKIITSLPIISIELCNLRLAFEF